MEKLTNNKKIPLTEVGDICCRVIHSGGGDQWRQAFSRGG
jgi:hypothetical protein